MSKKQKNTSHVCVVYGGCMKLGHVRYFTCDNAPEEEFEKYKVHYGNNIKGRYVNVEKSAESYANIRAELSKQKFVNLCGDLYEIHSSAAVKLMKDVTGAKKASIWGCTDTENESEQKEEKNVTKSNKSGKSEKSEKSEKPDVAQEIDKQEDDEPEAKAAPKKETKSKKPPQKKAAK